MNSANKAHQRRSPNCEGDLRFDMNEEVQHGLCWKERLKCSQCLYGSEMCKLYDEVTAPNSLPGVKAGKPNVGVQIALSKLPVGCDAVRTLCMAMNIPPPSESGMQKSANKTSIRIQEINKLDMIKRREEIKVINEIRGSNRNVVNVEADGMYNNPLYSGVGKTPFQPATQCTYVVCEQATSSKQVIALSCRNKLCTKKHDIRESAACLTKNCSRNTPVDMSIGSEKEWAKECLLDLKSNDLEVEYITTDPDSSAYRAAEELYSNDTTSTRPHHLLDTRHVSVLHSQYIARSDFVQNMMPGKTKCARELMQARLSVDMANRCQAELDKAYKTFGGDTNKCFRALSYACDAIAACYQGNHSKCYKNSFVCNGGKRNWVSRSVYLQEFQNFKIQDTPENTVHLLKCINFKLGPERLRKTKFNSNSQKSEAVNKCLRRSLPRDTTFSRNFAGRAHSAVHSVNLGAAESIITLTEGLGCAVSPGSKVAAALKKKQDKKISQAKYKMTLEYKSKRVAKTRELYKMHSAKHTEVQYEKGMLLRHSRLTAKATPEHNYSKKLLKLTK